MKKEMVMRDNGNYEEIICFIQHECCSSDGVWNCIQYKNDMTSLVLKFYLGDPYEDGVEEQINVLFCPFCGYSADK